MFLHFTCIVTGAVAYYSFQTFSLSEDKRRRFHLLKENQKQALPIKLQAYERLALFLERISPTKLLIRIAPLNDNKMDYQNLLVQHVEQEFEHNLTQQIYVSDECWAMVITAKNTILQNIRKTSIRVDVVDANKLRETILNDLFDAESTTTIALGYLKSEVKDFL